MGRPTADQQAEIDARRASALRLRAGGAAYPQIAERLGYASPGAASTDVARALASRRGNLAKEAANAVIMELERLDSYAQNAEWALGRARSAGDAELALKALDRLGRISDRRANLLGMQRGIGAPTPAHASDDLRKRRDERRRRAAGG